MTPGPALRRTLPPHGRGLRVGLLGGSFNPPHEGHILAALVALKRLRLDAVWLLVSPGNPLKDRRELAPLDERMDAARKLAAHPRLHVSAIEAALGASYTVDLVAYLRHRCPETRFVWIMGADNLTSFHRWRRWRDIARLVPIAVVDRPGSTLNMAGTRAGAFLAPYRVDERRAIRLPFMKPPSAVFLHHRRCRQASSALRAKREPAPPPTFHANLAKATVV
ncbi:nicotinate-nucleotide adenylyltransferase [Methylocella sp.]|uniref:nicotinate-nucleotide adenylyltransferase n=1 Tax=Methylocella sp. TaxID=1978226 RepID=UPI0035B1F41D